MYKEILAKAVQYEDETVRFLTDMVSIPAFSTKERDVVLCIKKEMEAAGFDEVFIDPLGNVIGRIGNGPKVIAFDAHIDTVYPGDLSLGILTLRCARQRPSDLGQGNRGSGRRHVFDGHRSAHHQRSEFAGRLYAVFYRNRDGRGL
jgi:hypothetical protein